MSHVREFYQDAQREWDRMDIPLCRIEFASTLAMIDRYFTGGMTVADIGSGPGRYTIELLKRGCHVSLFDLSAENIAMAKSKVAELGLTADDFLVGDAQNLSALNGRRFHGMLALGPLYHIVERSQRIAFLQAAKSLLASGGILIAAYLNAWGIARSLLTDAPEWFGGSQDVSCLLAGGNFAGPRACTGFTECVWSTPDGARSELEEAGFAVLEEIGAEGFAGGLGDELASIEKNDPAAFDRIVAFAVLTSKLPQYRRATDHLVLAARTGLHVSK